MQSKVARYRRKAHAPAAPAAAVPTSWVAAKETYALVTLNYKSVAKIGAFPLLIIGSVQALYAIYPTLLNLMLTVCGNLAATGMFAVGLQQMISRSVQNQMYRFRFGNKAWRIVASVCLALIPVVMLSLGILALGYVLAQNLKSPSVISMLSLIGILGGLALAAYTAVRFSVIMPAIALDEPIDLRSAMRATRGRAWQLWRGLIATLSPVILIAGALAFYAARTGTAAWAASSLQGFTVVVSAPLAITFLTLSYFRYVRKAAQPKMKIIGEPAWYLRAWYDVQKFIMLSARTIGLFFAQLKPKPTSAAAPPRAEPSARNQMTAPAAPAHRTAARRGFVPTPARTRKKPVTEAKSVPDKKEELARKVAAQLAQMEEEKLAKIAAILDEDKEKKSQAPSQKVETPTGRIQTPAAVNNNDASPIPHRRTRASERSAGARTLIDIMAANENGTKGTGKNKI